MARSFSVVSLVVLALFLGASGRAAAQDTLRVCADISGVICPEVVQLFPSAQSMVLKGRVYADTVPDTLDLAEWAKDYLRSSVDLLLPAETFTGVWVPPGSYAVAITAVFNNVVRPDDGASFCPAGVPACLDSQYDAQWAIGLQAMLRAQEMAGNVLDSGRVQKQLSSFRGIFASDQNGSNGVGTGAPGMRPPFGYSMMLLNDLQRLYPDNPRIRTLGDEYVRYHTATLTTDGTFSYWYNNVDTSAGGQAYNPHFLQVHQQALGGAPLSDWSTLTGSTQAFELGWKAAHYLQYYGGQQFWGSTNPSLYPPEPGQWVGHTLSYTTALHAILADARARYKRFPADPAVPQEIAFVRDSYEFFKRRGGSGLLGNFGVSSSLGVMMQIGMELAQFRFAFPGLIPLSTYYEDVERWTRNTAAETRVDAAMAAYIPDGPSGDPRGDRIASRAAGSFISDATHIASIPQFDLIDNNDGLWLMRALRDVWKNTVEITHDGTVAWVNFLLNNASQYMDVYSDLPYRGRVRVRLRSSIGSLGELAVRIPGWAGSNVTVYEDGQALPQGPRWSWNDRYVVIYPLRAGSTYQVSFPMAVQQLAFSQLRSHERHWHEENYGLALENFDGSQYTGTFLGDTLVEMDHRPAVGIPRYQRQQLAALISGGQLNEVDPPQKVVTRFLYGASSPSWINDSPINLAGTFRVVAAPDLSGDGRPDILMQYQNPGGDYDGALYAYVLNGTMVDAGGGWLNGGPIALRGFTVVGTADLNGDGKTDILMQFHAPGTSLDGAIYYYLMNGMTTIGGGWLNGNPINLPNFTVVGTADINQDGHPDILMQFHAPGTSQDGAIYYYLLSGTAVAGGGWLNGSPINLPNFTVVGSADFNADGKPDVLMQYQAPGTSLDGALYVYLLNGPNVAGGDWLGGAPVAMPGYRVAGLGDLNGDGKADLLFQYRSPGSPYDGAPAYCIINGMTTTCF